MDQYQLISWLPAPEEDSNNPEKYKDFSSSFKTKEIKPTETCRPTAKSNVKETVLKKPSFPYVQQKARACIRCVECGKGRLLYAEKKLSAVTKKKLEKSVENGFFVCGSELFDDDDDLNKIIFQHHENTCRKSMTAAFYSAGPKCLFYKFVCSTCFEENEVAVEEKYFKGLPRCKTCQESGYICFKWQK